MVEVLERARYAAVIVGGDVTLLPEREQLGRAGVSSNVVGIAGRGFEAA